MSRTMQRIDESSQTILLMKSEHFKFRIGIVSAREHKREQNPIAEPFSSQRALVKFPARAYGLFLEVGARYSALVFSKAPEPPF
jgi:hypothetical protein